MKGYRCHTGVLQIIRVNTSSQKHNRKFKKTAVFFSNFTGIYQLPCANRLGYPREFKSTDTNTKRNFRQNQNNLLHKLKKTHKKVNWKWYINVFFCKELNRIVFQIRLIIHRPLYLHLNPKTSHSSVKKWWMCENFKLCSLLHLLWHNALWTIRTNATNIFVLLNMLQRFD